jgi:GxxExxY protein
MGKTKKANGHGIHGRTRKNIKYVKNMDQSREGLMMLEQERTSYLIRGCVFEVYKQLGCGFLEKVYERALLRELFLHGLHAKTQVPFEVHYKGVVVGEYFADMVVEDSVILELKAQQQLPRECESQLLNYLKASGLRLGFLINFVFPRARIKRVIL